MIAFGPVPSRRLGLSLGINHIPLKHCSYACIYCQVGRTNFLEINRCEFFTVENIIHDVAVKISESKKSLRPIDYLTLVPDGEPTLDSNISRLIKNLRLFKLPIAVISNASLINQVEVQDSIMQADWISLKIDAVIDDEWRKINRPHGRLSLSSILAGILDFRSKYQGQLVTETMFVSGINDHPDSILKLTDYLLALQPEKSYLAIPVRPPAESWVKPPDPDILQNIFDTFSEKIPFTDLLFEAETSDFISTGDLEEDILGISAVHPIREQAILKMLAAANTDWSMIEKMVKSDKLRCVHYKNENFYLRCYS